MPNALIHRTSRFATADVMGFYYISLPKGGYLQVSKRPLATQQPPD